MVNFPPTFKNTNVGRDDIAPRLKEYAEKKRIFNSAKNNANIKLFRGKLNKHCIVAALLSGLETGLQEKLSLCTKHSNEVLQCSNCGEC